MQNFDGGWARGARVSNEAVAFDHVVSVFGIATLQQAVQSRQAIMWNRRIEVMREMIVLAVDEHGPTDQPMAKHDAAIRQPSGVGIGVLN